MQPREKLAVFVSLFIFDVVFCCCCIFLQSFFLSAGEEVAKFSMLKVIQKLFADPVLRHDTMVGL